MSNVNTRLASTTKPIFLDPRAPVPPEYQDWPEWSKIRYSLTSHCLPMLLGWLRAKHPRRNAAATWALTRAGAPLVERLVLEVMGSRRNPGYQLRLLTVIEQIGAPLGVDEFHMLMFASSMMKDPRVREAAGRIAMGRNFTPVPEVAGAQGLAAPQCPTRDCVPKTFLG